MHSDMAKEGRELGQGGRSSPHADGPVAHTPSWNGKALTSADRPLVETGNKAALFLEGQRRKKFLDLSEWLDHDALSDGAGRRRTGDQLLGRSVVVV